MTYILNTRMKSSVFSDDKKEAQLIFSLKVTGLCPLPVFQTNNSLCVKIISLYVHVRTLLTSSFVFPNPENVYYINNFQMSLYE